MTRGQHRRILPLFVVCVLHSFSLSAHSGALEEWRSLMEARYAPHASWESFINEKSLHAVDPGIRWWRTPEEIIASREPGARPLEGLHLALDPGHIGGTFSESEGRHFRISKVDRTIREGDLVLTVARQIRDELETLGARVTLLRESARPVNQPALEEILPGLMNRVPMPEALDREALLSHAEELWRAYFKEAYVIGELRARADRINQQIRPDAVLSLHINAAPWPRDESGIKRLALVEQNHSHVLIFGAVMPGEFSSAGQITRLKTKIANGSGPVEVELGAALGQALAREMQLPPSKYSGRNAVRIDVGAGYLWARNLLLLRQVDCPAVLLEPFLANSVSGYQALQAALRGTGSGNGAILDSYAQGVIEAIVDVYGSPETD